MKRSIGRPKDVILVAASILAADFDNLPEEITAVERAGTDLVHVDVMDGRFVSNKTAFSPELLKKLRKSCSIPFDVHLMVDIPKEYVKKYTESVDIITIHVERATREEFIKIKIFLKNKKVGVALNPGTSINRVIPFIPYADIILIMAVNPGFGGQRFIPGALEKIKALRKIYKGQIEIDGGINAETARLAVAAGADILVAGTYIFGNQSYAEAINSLRKM